MFLSKGIVGLFVFFFGLTSVVMTYVVVSSLFDRQQVPWLTRLATFLYAIGSWITFACGAYALFIDWSAINYALISFAAFFLLNIFGLAAVISAQYHKATPAALIRQELAEGEISPQLIELVQYIQDADLEWRRGLLRRVTKTVTRFATRLNIDRRYFFDRALTFLARRVDVTARSELAQALAHLEEAPRGTTRLLAYDDQISVSGYILRHSYQIDESDLIAIAKMRGGEHLAAIAARPHISQVLATVLATQHESQDRRELASARAENSSPSTDSTARAHIKAQTLATVKILGFLLISGMLFWTGVVGLVHLYLSGDVWPISSIVLHCTASLLSLVLGAFVYNQTTRRGRLPISTQSRFMFRLGWIVYVSGAGLLFIVVARTGAYLLYDYTVDEFSAPTWVAIAGIAATFLQWGTLVSVRRQFVPLAADVQAKDRRPPVLYLRSFERESRSHALTTTLRRPLRKLTGLFQVAKAIMKAGRDEDALAKALSTEMEAMVNRHALSGPLSFVNFGQSYTSGRFRMHDEQLVVANLMNRIGPYITAGRPTETFGWSDVGAAKMYVQNEDWQQTINRLITESAAIVIEAGLSQGLAWEIQQIVKCARPTKLLVILSETDEGYAEFLKTVGGLFPVPLPLNRVQSRLLMFSESWKPAPLLVPPISQLPDDFSTKLFYYVVRPFIRQNGFELSPSPLLADRITNWLRLHFGE